MRDYVRHFLGCRDCAQHFLAMADGLEYDVISEYDGVLWLWAAHNKVQ
jgi:thiol oxidase